MTALPFDPVTYDGPDGVHWLYTAGLDVWTSEDEYLTSEELRAATSGRSADPRVQT